jgi:hypothetical protein
LCSSLAAPRAAPPVHRALCAAADNRSTLRIKNDMTVPPILRMMPVGNAADSKSPGSKPMFAALKIIAMQPQLFDAEEAEDAQPCECTD